MRKKKNLIPRMERCHTLLVENPAERKGAWRDLLFPGCELRVELGCGKGRFTVETAAANPDVLFLAVEKVADVMIIAMERAKEAGLANVRFIHGDACLLPDILAPAEADLLYINFCDPWPTSRHIRRRLTSQGFLTGYRKVLRPGGVLRFKTDNLPLFEFSLFQFQKCGFVPAEITYHLHEKGPAEIMTDYEAKFYEQGLPIFRCVAVMEQQVGDPEETPSSGREPQTSAKF